jgi:hypothetical protein
MAETIDFYEKSKTCALDNKELAEWLRILEDRIRKFESQSQDVAASSRG